MTGFGYQVIIVATEVIMFVKFRGPKEAYNAVKSFARYWIGDDQLFCGGTFEEIVENIPPDTTFVLEGDWVLDGHKYFFNESEEIPEFHTPITQNEAHIRARDFYAPYKESDGESRMIAGELGISFEEYRGIYVSFEG